MFEQTKASRIRDFIDMAASARSEAEKTASQVYFRELFMSKAAGREQEQVAFLRGASDVASLFDQVSYQTPVSQGYDTIMNRIPKNEVGLRQTMQTMAISLAVIDAPQP
jgi:hypothetical protein